MGQLTTRVGRLTLRAPQVREGQFSPALFARSQRSEQALVLALMEMVVNGVSAREVTAIAEGLCGTGSSKSTVSAPVVRAARSAGGRLHMKGCRWAFQYVVAGATAEPARLLSAQELADRVCAHFGRSHDAHLTVPGKAA